MSNTPTTPSVGTAQCPETIDVGIVFHCVLERGHPGLCRIHPRSEHHAFLHPGWAPGPRLDIVARGLILLVGLAIFGTAVWVAATWGLTS